MKPEVLAHHTLAVVRREEDGYRPVCACRLVRLVLCETEAEARLAWATHVLALVGDDDRVVQLEHTVERADRAMDVALQALAQLAKKGNIKREVRESAAQALIEARNEQLDC